MLPKVTISYSVPKRNEIIQLGADAQKSYCKIKIEDNGIGFPESDAVRIFEPFTRLHTKDKYEGTGIGLAICKKIMMQHSGYITAVGIPGAGTTFNVYLPM